MRIRRKKGEDEQEAAGEAVQETAETAAPDPAAWALPADAAVASGGDVRPEPEDVQFAGPLPGGADELETAPTQAEAPSSDEPISAGSLSSPGAGYADGPRAAAAAAAGAYAQPPKDDPVGASPASADVATGERPELLVAGAFVGAFLFAKIIKRIGD